MTRDEQGRFQATPFWERVNKSAGCWEWTGYRNRAGYGRTQTRVGRKLAHHISWFLTHGVWPKYLLHSCDNPPCVNPAHLSEGNNALNNADRDAKGRQRHLAGEEHHQSKLTAESVLEMRRRWWGGEAAPALGAEFGVTRTVAYQACSGKSWRHLPMPDGERRMVGQVLTPKAAEAIKQATGSHSEIGARFGISKSMVGLIKRGARWKSST